MVQCDLHDLETDLTGTTEDEEMNRHIYRKAGIACAVCSYGDILSAGQKLTHLSGEAGLANLNSQSLWGSSLRLYTSSRRKL